MAAEIKDMARTLRAKSHVNIRDRAHLRFWLDVSDLDSTLAEKIPDLIGAKLNYRIAEWRGVVDFVDKTLFRKNIKHTILAHAGSGICLINLLMNQSGNGYMDEAVEAIGQMLQRSREAGGNMIIQRAPTTIKRHLKIWGNVGSDFILMKRLKEQLDLSGVMSPGRFVGGL